MYYLLSYNLEDEKKDLILFGTIYTSNQEIVDKIFDKGNSLKKDEIKDPFEILLNEKDSKIKNRKRKDKIRISVIKAGFLFLISPPAQALFKKLNIDNLQYFDVTIKSNDLEIKDYKIVNITDKIDCADVSSSKLELYDDGDFMRIRELVLDETKIPKGKQIFLLGRRATDVILVHEDLRQAIEKENLTGFKFFDLKDAGKIY